MSAISPSSESSELNEVHGRIINAEAVSYNLPIDETEWNRLNIQHRSVAAAMNGIYPLPQVVDSMLAGIRDSPIRILDVGCGSGIWAIEIARRIPNSQVLGIDISPVPPSPLGCPPNVTFKQENINDGLINYRNQFDFIHLRFVVTGVTNVDKSLQDIEACLKPGRLMVVVAPDWSFDETRERYMKMARIDGDDDTDGASEQGSWFMIIFYESEDRSRIDGSNHAVDLTIFDQTCWDHALCDPDNTISGSYWIPIGDWIEENEENRSLRKAGRLMQENLLQISKAFAPLIARGGIDRKKVDEWVDNAQKELHTMQPRIWTRIRFYLTQRRADPALQALVVSALSKATVAVDEPTLEIYRTREQALAAIKRRKATLGTFPRSAVSRALEGRDGDT